MRFKAPWRHNAMAVPVPSQGRACGVDRPSTTALAMGRDAGMRRGQRGGRLGLGCEGAEGDNAMPGLAPDLGRTGHGRCVAVHVTATGEGNGLGVHGFPVCRADLRLAVRAISTRADFGRLDARRLLVGFGALLGAWLALIGLWDAPREASQFTHDVALYRLSDGDSVFAAASLCCGLWPRCNEHSQKNELDCRAQKGELLPGRVRRFITRTHSGTGFGPGQDGGAG